MTLTRVNSELVKFVPDGTGAVDRTVGDKLRESVSVFDFMTAAQIADVQSGAFTLDTANAFLSAIEESKNVFVPKGNYKVSALTSTRTGVVSITGEEGTVIQFSDDGTSTGVGFNFNSFSTIKLRDLTVKTGAADGRIAAGDFIGIQSYSASASRTWDVSDVTFQGFSTAGIYSQSLIDSDFRNVDFRLCDNGIKLEAGYFPVAGTTTRFYGGYSTQCIYAHNVSSLSESIWDGCIFEYNTRGISGTNGIKNTVIGCYAEVNTQYGAYWSAASAFLFANNYSNGAGDSFTTVGSTGSYGFDAIGSTYVDNQGITSRIVQLYDRTGALAERIKASNTNYSGLTAIEDSSGAVVGIVPKRLAAQNTGHADQTIMFMVVGSSTKGVPSGWTVTNSGTGIWDVSWPSPLTGNTRWPYISVQGIPAASNATGAGQIDVIATVRARDAGGVWNGFQNMDVGFQVRIYTIDPTTGIMTLSANAAMVQVSW